MDGYRSVSRSCAAGEIYASSAGAGSLSGSLSKTPAKTETQYVVIIMSSGRTGGMPQGIFFFFLLLIMLVRTRTLLLGLQERD